MICSSMPQIIESSSSRFSMNSAEALSFRGSVERPTSANGNS